MIEMLVFELTVALQQLMDVLMQKIHVILFYRVLIFRGQVGLTEIEPILVIKDKNLWYTEDLTIV